MQKPISQTLLDGQFRIAGEMILVAAASGNPSILRKCLRNKFDCMVEDSEGRTALHYAADANMFKFLCPPHSFYCSVEYPCKVKEQWMKKHKAELVQSYGNPSAVQGSNQNPQSNAHVGRRACVLMLLQAGVDLSQEDKKGNIPDPGKGFAGQEVQLQSSWKCPISGGHFGGCNLIRWPIATGSQLHSHRT